MNTRDPRRDKEYDYSKQRRYQAARSDKADRRKRPRAKAMEHRAHRRGASQGLHIQAGPLAIDEADGLEQRLSAKRPKELRYWNNSLSLRDWLSRPMRPIHRASISTD